MHIPYKYLISAVDWKVYEQEKNKVLLCDYKLTEFEHKFIVSYHDTVYKKFAGSHENCKVFRK